MILGHRALSIPEIPQSRVNALMFTLPFVFAVAPVYVAASPFVAVIDSQSPGPGQGDFFCDLVESDGYTCTLFPPSGPDGSIDAVRGVDLDLHRGEAVALVGESAAGKSTVALAILQILPGNAESSGEIVFDGLKMNEASEPELRRVRGDEIAIIFQDAQSALTPTMSVGHQIAELFRAHRDVSQDEAELAAVEVLRKVLPDPVEVARSYPFQLSGGMAQRALIAMAMALDPAVVIADEPTSSLDANVRQEMLGWLEQMRDDRDVAVLLITHDLGIVARFADRVAVMYAGEIVESADVRTIFRAPKHPYTFGLLQSVPTLSGERGRRLPVMKGQPPDLSDLPPQCPFLPRCNKATSRCRTDDAPPLAATDDGGLVACYNPIVVPRAG